MKLTAGQLHDAMIALAQIITRPRQIPQLAKYRIAKLHSSLEPDFAKIEDARVALVHEHGQEIFADEAKTISQGWQVQPGTEGFKKYIDGWNAIRGQEFEVNVLPITLESLGNETSGIEAGEFKMLEKFIVEASELALPPAASAPAGTA